MTPHEIPIGEDLDAEELRILVLKVLRAFLEKGFAPHITAAARALYTRCEPATFLPPTLYGAIANLMEDIGWELHDHAALIAPCQETIDCLEHEDYDC